MSREYWAARYRSGDMPWEKGEASPGLVDFLAEHRELPRGSVIVPGCGTGHDARAWASAGFATVGVDITDEAVARASAGLRASAEMRLSYYRADFLRAAPAQKFDWVFEHTLYCAIQPSERDAYVAAVVGWLRPGGDYLAVNYLECGPEGPPWPATREELLTRFAPHFDLQAEWVPRSYPNRTGRERMFWWRRKVI